MTILSSPLEVFAISAVVLWSSAWFGATVIKKRRTLEEDERQDLGIINEQQVLLYAAPDDVSSE